MEQEQPSDSLFGSPAAGLEQRDGHLGSVVYVVYVSHIEGLMGFIHSTPFLDTN